MTTFATMATSTARLGYMSVKPHGKFLKRPATQVGNREIASFDFRQQTWIASRGFQFESAWNQAIWFYLRRVLDLPSPHPFSVDQLPVLAIELQRINAITVQVHDVIREIERDAAKRIFRKGESADVVIADLRRIAALRMAEVKDDIALLPSWLSKDVDAIADRRLNRYGGHLANDETPGYFDPAKGATP